MAQRSIITCDVCGTNNEIATELRFVHNVNVMWQGNGMARTDCSVDDMCDACCGNLVEAIRDAMRKKK